MSKILDSKVIGQKEAIEKISKAVLRSRAGIQDPERPIGIFLFLGLQVLEKQNLQKLFQIFYLIKVIPLFRLDMSEYMEKHSVSKLIGSPPGYVGYESGLLTESMRRKPYQVILLDEIEKLILKFITFFFKFLMKEDLLTHMEEQLILKKIQ